MTFEEKLDNKLKENQIYLSQDQLYKFKVYYKLLVEYNNKFNLTAITDEDDVIVKHFLDSLLGAKYINNGRVIDIGSGAGFPGVAIKILNNDIELVLVDSVKKKVDFLQMLISQLNLNNVQCIHSRIEDLAHNDEYREKFDFCVSRAVAPLNVLVEYAVPFLKIGARAYAYKSQQLEEEISRAKFALMKMGGAISNTYEYTVDGMDRKILEIKKITSTPSEYPRGKNLPRTKTLNG